MNVTLPDGTVINDVPDGMSKADLTAKLAANGYDVSKLTQPTQASPVQSAPQGTGSTMLDAGNALASGFMRGATRLAGLPVDTAANVIDLGKAAIGAPYTALTGKAPPSWLDIGDRSNVTGSGDNLIKNLGSTKLGSAIVNPTNPSYEGGYLQTIGGGMAGAMTPGQAALSAASAVAGKATYDRTGNQALAITAGMLPYGANALRRSDVPAPPTQKGDTLAAGQEEGYVVPPSQVGAGWVNGRLESIAGKAALKQDAILRNQDVTNKLAVRSLGLPPDDPITVNALDALRDRAGKAGYTPIDSISQINSTPDYEAALKSINADLGRPNSAATILRNPNVTALVNDLNQPSFTGSDVNALIKQLRESGNAKQSGSYGAIGGDQDRNLGSAMVQSSGALENLITQNLLNRGPSNIVPALLDARRAIAQTYTIQNALNDATGDVNAGALARAFKSKKPLEGDQRLIGRFSAAFPTFTKTAVGEPTPGVSALEAVAVPIMAAAGTVASGGAHGLIAGGLPLLRSPVRNMLLSEWYQRMFAHQPDVSGPMNGMTPEDQGALTRALIGSGLLSEPNQ
jgi:hypothetical protein